MEEDMGLLVETKNVETKKKKIIQILKKINIKRTIFIALFFLCCYFISELLNGNHVNYDKIFGISSSWQERWVAIKSFLWDFFKCPKFIVNYLLFIFLYWIIYGITNRTKISCAIILILNLIFGILNYVVVSLRGMAITISDIYSIKTAMNVANGVKLTIDGNFILALVLFIALVIVLIKSKSLKEKLEQKTTKMKNITIALGVIGLIAMCVPDYFTNDVELWNINRAYANSGAGLTIARMAKDFKVSKPKKYVLNDAKNLLLNYYDETEVVDDTENLPNVVVIMNESFSDLSLAFDMDLRDDPIAFFHELENSENVVSGVMHSSQFGGGTANVEYEFITQNATAFLPAGSMPYQQYITGDVKQSIVSYMNKLGYTTYGIHSWDKSGYSREKIYRYLGFDYAWFKNNMNNLQEVHNGYSSDQSTYEAYYDIMNNKPDGEKNFTFIVTMQNHMPYNIIDWDEEYFIDDNYTAMSYFQSEYMADNALKNFINYLENYDEDTIVLFFGDHQPNVDQDDLYSLNGQYSEDESTHVVPFFIWANFDIEEQHGIETSTNYLESLLLDVAGLPKDSYTQYIEELRGEIPVITNHYYIGNDGNSYSIDDKYSPYYDKLQEYWKIIYYNMFDNK